MRANSIFEAVHAAKLLGVAAGCRERANRSTNPYQADVLRRTAEALEQAAARATGPLAQSSLGSEPPLPAGFGGPIT